MTSLDSSRAVQSRVVVTGASGAAVDGIHAVTSTGLAVAERRWRRSALADAAIAAGFALGTGLTARTAIHRTR